MKSLLLFSLSFSLLAFTNSLSAKTKVIVGAYEFPPYYETSAPSKTLQLVELLNQNSKDYSFEILEIPANRRYEAIENGSIHIVFFEAKEWGWKNKNVSFSNLLAEDYDTFIANKEVARTPEYFHSLKDKSIAAVVGYHYSFADFNSDQEQLEKNHKVILTRDHYRNIRLVAEKRIDLAIVTKSYLDKVFKKEPELKNKILVSSKIDHNYKMFAVLKSTEKKLLKELNSLLPKSLAISN